MGGEPARYPGSPVSEISLDSYHPLLISLKCEWIEGFSNFQVNKSINVKFHPGRRNENYDSYI